MARFALTIASSLFFFCIVFVVFTYDTIYALDRPVLSLVCCCLVAGTNLLFIAKFLPHIFDLDPLLAGGNHVASFEEIPKVPYSVSHPAGSSPRRFQGLKSLRPYTQWVIPLVGIFLISVRIELFRQATANYQCTSMEYEYALPFLISIFDYFRNHRNKRANFEFSRRAAFPNVASRLSNGNLNYVISAAILASTGLVLSSITRNHRSTYICPINSHGASFIQVVKFVSLLIDTFGLVSIVELFRRRSNDWGKSTLQLFGIILLGVVAIWLPVGIVVYFVRPGYFLFTAFNYYRAVLTLVAVVNIICVTSLWLVSRFGLLNISLLTSFLIICATLTRLLFLGTAHYIQPSVGKMIFSLLMLPIGGAVLLNANKISETESRFTLSTKTWVFRLFLAFCAGSLTMTLMRQSHQQTLPIDILIQNGKEQHEMFLNQAKVSNNLEEAVSEYKRRYKQYPPPGFDQWYEFATSKKSLIIDDFDQIYSNLAPFRAYPPNYLRRLTHELAIDSFSDVGAIRIRNGSSRAQEGLKPTHAWMITATMKMLDAFVEHLPDMDILLNLNDEPRVAIPHDAMSEMKSAAKPADFKDGSSPIREWSADRDSGWDPIEPVDKAPYSLFTDYAKYNIWDVASQICAPQSKARSERIWNRRDLCLDCFQPHSLEQFVSDWQLAADICHQPDLKYLHGFFTSPASWKTSQHLVPLFSQSSLPGFGDILFPSPWNYIDKVKYEPSPTHPDVPYLEKKNALFWIGATSEGFSINGEWKGMTRQRLTHLMNNNSANPVTMLMRTGTDQALKYHVVDGAAPKEKFGLQAEVSLSELVRCDDCETQEQEMGSAATRISFQEHWRYRYLFDMDGAGFSGRFHAFLQSHSLPFKTGLFRQWFDPRLTPWHHFVPQDMRLHDVWSTLGYFAGITVDGGSKKSASVLMEPHDEEGEYIAEQGRDWAQKSLRKEDMEIYFFRLLLEWGRLTDDRRDQLGFDQSID